MGDLQLPTLADVARLAGVSLATASRVLGGSRDRVSDQLAARVMAAAQELQYVPNAHAQALARASSTTVGLIVHDVSDPYFSEIARGVLRSASDRGHLVMICNSYRDPARELQYVAALRAQRVHAIVLAGSGYTDEAAEERVGRELAAFASSGGRVALVGRHHLPMDAVLPGNVDGAAIAARHLASLGHRDIAVVAGPMTLTTIEDRLAGFSAGLAERGVRFRPESLRHVDFTRNGGHAATIDLLESGLPLTAVFALNDAMAIGVLAALRERSVNVPGDVSVIGFDDIPLAVDLVPSLTTVRLPMEEMGVRAVELALVPPDAERRAGDGRNGSRVLPSSSELVIRASTAPAPR